MNKLKNDVQSPKLQLETDVKTMEKKKQNTFGKHRLDAEEENSRRRRRRSKKVRKNWKLRPLKALKLHCRLDLLLLFF